jgi:predicted transcriptional regulator
MFDMPRLVKPGDSAWNEAVSVAQMVFGSGVNLALIHHLAGRGEPATRAQLAEELTEFSPATLSKAVGVLAQAGVLEKTPVLGPATGRLNHAFSVKRKRIEELLGSLRLYALGADT